MSKKWRERKEKEIRKNYLHQAGLERDYQVFSIKDLVESYLTKIKADGYRVSTIETLIYKIDRYIYERFFVELIGLLKAIKVVFFQLGTFLDYLLATEIFLK